MFFQIEVYRFYPENVIIYYKILLSTKNFYYLLEKIAIY